MGNDLGTYHLRITLWDGRGWLTQVLTGCRFTEGTSTQSPLHASAIPPTWESEQELIDCFVFQYEENNWSCDCNRALDLARAYQQPEPDDNGGICLGGPKIRIKKFEILNPQLKVVYSREPFETEQPK